MTTGFLITSLSGKLRRISDIVKQHVLKKLYIYVSMNKTQSGLRNSEWVSRKIVDMYSSSFQLFPAIDVRIILNDVKLQEEKLSKIKDYNVDVIILPKNFDEEKIQDFKNYSKNLYVVYVDGLSEDDDQIKVESNKIYSHVVLGGTFDRLHTGHKILLSEALLRCSKKITVGVTDGDMIKGKKLWELIEPCSKRISTIENFIKEVDKSVEFEVVPITDIYGPTKSDPSMDLIIVSAETQRGGYKVNELRKEKGLNELDMYVVKLAEDLNKNNEEEEKISSSNLRMRLLGSYIRKPEIKPDLPTRPYIIGLTGGVASGKSTICEYLKTLGAAVIDCDKVAHQLYKSGTEIYLKLIDLFGTEIVASDGEINRKVLGGIVFGDTEKLHMLNNLMWPAILEAAIRESERLYVEEKKDIVVLEAAVLIKAGWQKSVHEVWASFIPKQEAITRIMNRNNLSEAEAVSRVEAQPTNTEIVEAANVVFCSLWSNEFTRSQVDKAWSLLQSKKMV